MPTKFFNFFNFFNNFNNFNNKSHKFCLITGLMLMSGCSTYNDNFDCPAGSGVGCKSLSSVNTMVEKGMLPAEPELDDIAIEDRGSKIIISQLEDSQPISLSNNSPIMRSAATSSGVNHSRIWLAGYEDAAGNNHDESFVNVNTVVMQNDS